jgi:cytochrome c biogenesis protein CcdA
MTIGTIGLAFLAGCLSVLSPCVLPLVPIVLGSAASEHRLGSVALAAGLALSFTTIGLFVATIGFAIGLDQDVLRTFGAVLLIALGFVLVLPNLQAQVAPQVRSAIGLRNALAALIQEALVANFRLGCFSAPCGALAWARRSAPLRFSRRKARILFKLR